MGFTVSGIKEPTLYSHWEQPDYTEYRILEINGVPVVEDPSEFKPYQPPVLKTYWRYPESTVQEKEILACVVAICGTASFYSGKWAGKLTADIAAEMRKTGRVPTAKELEKQSPMLSLDAIVVGGVIGAGVGVATGSILIKIFRGIGILPRWIEEVWEPEATAWVTGVLGGLCGMVGGYRGSKEAPSYATLLSCSLTSRP